MTKRIVAYIDESGRLADPDDRYVALAAIVTLNVRGLQKVIKKANRKRKKVRFKKVRGREVKWSNAPDSLKQRVLGELGRRDIEIFWLIVDKEGKAVSDTPDNYSLMVSELAGCRRSWIPYG